MRNQIETVICGKKVKLSERSAEDVLSLAEFASGGEMSGSKSMRISAILVNQSLKYWIDSHNWLSRYFLNKEFSIAKLLKGLSPKEIKEYCDIIAKLEGDDNKKKVKVAKQSDEKSPKV